MRVIFVALLCLFCLHLPVIAEEQQDTHNWYKVIDTFDNDTVYLDLNSFASDGSLLLTEIKSENLPETGFSIIRSKDCATKVGKIQIWYDKKLVDTYDWKDDGKQFTTVADALARKMCEFLDTYPQYIQKFDPETK